MRPPQEGALSTHIAKGTLEAEQMLCARMANTIMLPEGVLVSLDVMDRMMVSMTKGFGLNLATLPWETLYHLQDGITTELHARKNCTIHVLSEQKINMEQLSLERNELVS